VPAAEVLENQTLQMPQSAAVAVAVGVAETAENVAVVVRAGAEEQVKKMHQSLHWMSRFLGQKHRTHLQFQSVPLGRHRTNQTDRRLVEQKQGEIAAAQGYRMHRRYSAGAASARGPALAVLQTHQSLQRGMFRRWVHWNQTHQTNQNCSPVAVVQQVH
jgi:hypothetical protein